MFGSRLAVRNALTLVCLLGLVLATVAQWQGAGQVLAAGTISGTVFQDYNGNGTRDTNSTASNLGGGTVGLAVDRGLGGVTVTAYTSAGAVAGTASTAADGSYTLNASGTGPYRVEFSGFPAGFQPGPVGPSNGSTVRFVNDGATANVNLGIHLPGEYCQNNPDLVTTCYKAGGLVNVVGPTEETVVGFPYTAGSADSRALSQHQQPAAASFNVPADVVGSVWGIDYSRSRRQVYVSAFFKKHIALGPGAARTSTFDEDPSAIYLLNRTTGARDAVFNVPNATANPRTFSTALAPDPYRFDDYNLTWNAVGKVSLGGIALSDDESVLYVMNLEDRTLYALNAATGAVIGSQAVPGVAAGSSLPLPSGACATADVRPFAVTFEQGQLYVGITCTAESSTTVDTFTDSNANGRFDHNIAAERNSVVDGDGNGIYNRGDVRQLRAYIYTVNPTSLAFGATPALQIPLNYPRGIANANGAPPAEWRPWIPGFDFISIGERTVYYPQPWLTDITFQDGNMIVGLRDRTGDTTGYQAPADPSQPGTVLFDGVGVGDVLRACGSPTAGWTLESGAACGGITTVPRPGGPALQPQGPGDAEYYFDDGYGIRGDDVNHDEVSIGGGVQVPGYPNIVVTTFDAFPFLTSAGANQVSEVFNGGFRWYNNSTGAYDKSYVIYESAGTPPPDPLTMGKANGLGDLIVLCDEAPIEIGNRVWRDDNLNGVQDPNEPVIPGVTLELYEGNNPTPIATAVTDAEGNYIFSAYRAPGDSTTALRYGLALRPNTQYSVRIPNATGVNQQPALVGLLPTLANAGGASGDMRDSDGVQSGTLVLTNLTTGGVGANNHTYDFGFVAAPTAITLDSFQATTAGGGVVVSWSTSLELDTWGFHLYRSATGRLADAVRVTDPLVLAKGRGNAGASYSFSDPTATEGPYTYWLEEQTTAGARTVYGPVTTDQLAGDGQYRSWLPLVLR